MTDDVQQDENTEQTVDTEANAETQQSQAAAETSAAQEENERSLDDILKEFEPPHGQNGHQQDDHQVHASEPRQQDTQQQQQPVVDPTELAEIRAQIQALHRKTASEEVSRVVSAVKGDTDVKDRVAEAWVDAMAREDPRISAAFNARHQNPRAWAQTQAWMAKEFRKEFGGKVDKQATESRDAVSAAVRGSSTAASRDDFPDPKQIMSMPEEEWRDLQRKMGVSPY